MRMSPSASPRSGYFYAPDPSSQSVCTIGGNVAENSGGAHCLKYGFTVTHVLALEVVLPSGELVQLGSPALDAPGYDLAGVFVGSEGTLGVATKITLRIVKRPEVVQTLLAAFDSIQAAGQTVSDIIAAGMLPSALEIMDALAIEAAEAAVHAHYPDVRRPAAGGAGRAAQRSGGADARSAGTLCSSNGAWEIRVAQSEQERALVWKGRKAAFAAVGRISPNYIVQDGVIPRTALPHLLTEIDRMAVGGWACAWPMSSMPATATCIRWCSTIAQSTGRKRWRSIFPIASCISAWITAAPSPASTAWARKSRRRSATCSPSRISTPCNWCAAPSIPENIANPDKVFPRPRLCAEKPGPYTPHPLETAGIAEIF